MIPGMDIHLYLQKLPIEKSGASAPNTSAYLESLNNDRTGFRPEGRGVSKRRLSKPLSGKYGEFERAQCFTPVVTETKRAIKSISKAKLSPLLTDEAFVFAQLAKNLEAACIKARRYKLSACL